MGGGDGEQTAVAASNAADASEADFNALVSRMNTLLAPLALNSALNLAFCGFGENGEPEGCAGKEVMILADRSLSALPLEALSIFNGAKSLARDFSLHLLYHRIMEGSEPNPDGGRTPKDNVHVVTEAQMGMIIDPRNEDRSPGDDSDYPRKTVSETWAETAKSTGKWGGIVGPTDHIASGQEWQTILQTRDGGGAVYYGMGRALSYCPPSLVAGLSLSGCKMLLLLDRAENDASNRRQSKLDNQKTAAQLALEQPFQTAALFSMAGVNTVMLNQWSNTLHANRRLILGWLAVMKESKEDNLASALQKVIRPAVVASDGGGRPESKSGKKGKGKGKKGDDAAGEDAAPAPVLKGRVKYNTIVYGLPHTTFDK